jgi:hypothetical protein
LASLDATRWISLIFNVIVPLSLFRTSDEVLVFVSSASENMKGFSEFGPLLTPSLQAVPFPNKNRPGTMKPSSEMKAQESTLLPESFQCTPNVYNQYIILLEQKITEKNEE